MNAPALLLPLLHLLATPASPAVPADAAFLAPVATAAPADLPASSTSAGGSLVADAPGARSTYVFDEDRGLRVVCAPLLVCDIALETGEVISDFATGDSKDWFVTSFTAGPRETPHVILKPQRYDLATNLIVATNRRTYHFHLVSPSEPVAHAKTFHYDRLVSFSYPAATLQHLLTGLEPRAAAARPEAPAGCADPTCWSYRYRVSAGRFAPLRVMDDGAHVYIQLSSHEAPALFEVLPDRSTAPLNYRFSADSRWIVVDHLFDSARLVVRVARREMTTTIERVKAR
jgi:P-type conjugative transfer protein TrbG